MFDSMKKILVVNSFLLAMNVSYADTSAMDCVKTNWEGNNYVFRNV